MKTFAITCLAFSFALTALAVMANETGDLDYTAALLLGEELFHDPALGGSTNELSCSSCHSGGYGLQNADDLSNPRKAVSNCLTVHLQGYLERKYSPIGPLTLYVLSLAGTEQTVAEPEEPLSSDGGSVKGWERNKAAGWVPPGSVQSISGAQAEESESRGNKQSTGKK